VLSGDLDGPAGHDVHRDVIVLARDADEAAGARQINPRMASIELDFPAGPRLARISHSAVATGMGWGFVPAG
jgi:hypothetical protein